MCIRYTTGNMVDVVVDMVDNKLAVVGIQPWKGELIPLPNPKALADTLLSCLGEEKK